MGIKLVTYNQSHVTALDDAVIIQYICGVGGVIQGCDVSAPTTHSIMVSSGHGVICGRKFSIETETIPVQLPAYSQSGRVKIKIDLSNPEKPIDLIVEMNSYLAPLQQDENINFTNGVYEYELATFSVSGSGISGLRQTFEASIKSKPLKDIELLKKKMSELPEVHYGSAPEPSPSLGKDGDFYVQR